MAQPKNPAVLKVLRDSELLRRSVFTTPPPPHIYYVGNPSLRGKVPAKRRKMCQRRGGRHSKSLRRLLRIVNLLRRGIFSAAGSFGLGFHSIAHKRPCELAPTQRLLQKERRHTSALESKAEFPKTLVPKTLAFAFALRLRSKTRCFKTRVLGGRRLPNGKPQERLRFRDLRSNTLAFKKRIAIAFCDLKTSLGARACVQVLCVQKARRSAFAFLSGKKKAHKHKPFGPVALGTPQECPGDKPGLSPGQSGFVPGTNPGFLLTLHSGSPVCPWDKPSLSRDISGTKGGRKSLCVKRLCAFFVPYLKPTKVKRGVSVFCVSPCFQVGIPGSSCAGLVSSRSRGQVVPKQWLPNF